MKNPTQEQFQVVIDTLIKANELAKNKAPINMMQGVVTHDNVCGTPMCHGGWYAVVMCINNTGVDYSDGANVMAEDLGFEDMYYLSEWAVENPEIWGNKYGDTMFHSGNAFNEFGDTGFDLQTIIDHWKGVKERAASC